MKFSSGCIAFYVICFASAGVLAQETQRPGIESYRIGEAWEWKEKLVVDAEPNKALMESVDIRTVALDAGETEFVKKFPRGL